MADSIFEPEISRSLKYLCSNHELSYPIALECKKITGTSLPFSSVKDHQLQALIDFESVPFYQKMRVAASVSNFSRFKLDTGFDFLACPYGRSWVLVNFRATKKASGKEIPKGTNKCFAVSIDNYVEGMNDLLSSGRKSFPYNWFIDNSMELDRCRWEVEKGYEYGWDLLPITQLYY